ncbi:hypothetical protein HYQ46_010007 [Verticillium longisporum]|nr:hypothetical protein HYQ46_010007 [Verticillium longisporum]
MRQQPSTRRQGWSGSEARYVSILAADSGEVVLRTRPSGRGRSPWLKYRFIGGDVRSMIMRVVAVARFPPALSPVRTNVGMSLPDMPMQRPRLLMMVV